VRKNKLKVLSRPKLIKNWHVTEICLEFFHCLIFIHLYNFSKVFFSQVPEEEEVSHKKIYTQGLLLHRVRHLRERERERERETRRLAPQLSLRRLRLWHKNLHKDVPRAQVWKETGMSLSQQSGRTQLITAAFRSRYFIDKVWTLSTSQAWLSYGRVGGGVLLGSSP
jgi:hypothetical protein